MFSLKSHLSFSLRLGTKKGCVGPECIGSAPSRVLGKTSGPSGKAFQRLVVQQAGHHVIPAARTDIPVLLRDPMGFSKFPAPG